jgi:hypothetical protein
MLDCISKSISTMAGKQLQAMDLPPIRFLVFIWGPFLLVGFVYLSELKIFSEENHPPEQRAPNRPAAKSNPSSR